jgi:hypothetical protein
MWHLFGIFLSLVVVVFYIHLFYLFIYLFIFRWLFERPPSVKLSTALFSFHLFLILFLCVYCIFFFEFTDFEIFIENLIKKCIIYFFFFLKFKVITFDTGSNSPDNLSTLPRRPSRRNRRTSVIWWTCTTTKPDAR